MQTEEQKNKSQTNQSVPATDAPKTQPAQAENEHKPKVELKPRITVFVGSHLPKVPRTMTTEDPSRPGATITTRTMLEGYKHFVVQHVVGYGHFTNTKEPYVTLQGQYGPGQTARITASAQHAEVVRRAFLNHNVDQSSGTGINESIKWPLIEEKVLTVFGRAMTRREPGGPSVSTRGLAVDEMYLENSDGTFKTIIGATEESATRSERSLEEAFI